MPESTSNMTVIGADTQIKGELSFDTTARILGRVDGQITSKGELQIGDGANCRATLDAGKIIIDGYVEGNINARDRVQLNSKAKVVGDVSAGTLVVAEGASFIGHCRVGPEAGKTPAPKTTRNGTTNGATPHSPVTVPITGTPGPITNGTDNLAAAFAGLEAKLAGIGRAKAEATAE